MAAEHKTNAFLIGEATLMMAPFTDATNVFELVPATHSVGLIKNLQLSQEQDYVELRKGIQQLLVDNKKSNVRASLSCEVYEYTAQNILRSMSLATAPVAIKRGRLTANATGAQATISVASDPLTDGTGAISATGDIPNGATVLIQRNNDEGYTFVARVTAATTGTGPYIVTVAIPTGISFTTNDRVWIINELPVAPTSDQDFFKVKVSGKLANDARPVSLVFPKVRVTKGFQMAFDETNYGSMPWEFMPFLLSTAEATGRLAEIGTSQYGALHMAS